MPRDDEVPSEELFPPGKDYPRYARYLDKMGCRRRAPRVTISRAVGESVLLNRTAADRYEPGQYKADRDFVLNKRFEVRKDICSDFERAPSHLFNPQERADADGILRGIRNPGNLILWINPNAPGQYNTAIDGTECPARVRSQSVPAWTQRRGEPQETVRALKQSKSSPGPGTYMTPTRFDVVNSKREKDFDRIVRKEAVRRDQSVGGHYAAIFASVRAARPSGDLGQRAQHHAMKLH